MAEQMNMQIRFFALGTMNTVRVYQSNDQDILDKVYKRVNQIDDEMSVFKTDSDIYKLNKASGHGFVQIGEDTLKLIERAIHYSEMTNGSFDITVGPIVKLWGIGKKLNYIPEKNDIEKVKSLVDFQDIVVDHVNKKVALLKEGQSVDLGGIAKGYAADEVKRILVKNGIKHAMINLGGNVVTVGSKEDGTPWKIGIQNPVMPTGKFLGTLSVVDKTIVTSGTYERFFMKDGICYHHILDPKTGYPAETDLSSVTVICDNSMDADALTTSLFLLGVEKGKILLEQLGIEALFITNRMKLIMTKGFETQFQLNDSLTLRRNA